MNNSSTQFNDRCLGDCCVIIPSLNPSNELCGLVEKLTASGFQLIVVVDDGSSHQYELVFDSISRAGAVVLRHAENRGKGEALKTGFAYAKDTTATYVITVDADGQHLVEDVVRVAEAANAQDSSRFCVLGVRDFSVDVPFKSLFGNSLTRRLFERITPLGISDTQTGLRAFPSLMIDQLMEIQGSRYEYEMNVLLWVANSQVKVVEIRIATVYVDGNSHSHFRPVIDSLRIYWVLLRDAILATSSFGIDIALFALFFSATGNVYQSTFVARAVSSVYNFAGNRYVIFRTFANQQVISEALKYFALVILIAGLSGTLVTYFVAATHWNPTFCKVGADLLLYSVSFSVRRIFIFSHRQ